MSSRSLFFELQGGTGLSAVVSPATIRTLLVKSAKELWGLDAIGRAAFSSIKVDFPRVKIECSEVSRSELLFLFFFTSKVEEIPARFRYIEES